MNIKAWKSIGVCLIAGLLTVQAQAAGNSDKAAKDKSKADVKSAVDAINNGKFEIVSVEASDKEGWYNVMMLLPNGKKVSISVSGNSSLIDGYVEDTGTSEPAAPVEEPAAPVVEDPFANS